MSVNDFATLGHSIGFSPTLDSVKSMRYEKMQAGATSSSGNGMSNNLPFGAPDNSIAVSEGIQKSGIANSALKYKIGRYLDTTSNANGLFGANNLVTKARGIPSLL